VNRRGLMVLREGGTQADQGKAYRIRITTQREGVLRMLLFESRCSIGAPDFSVLSAFSERQGFLFREPMSCANSASLQGSTRKTLLSPGVPSFSTFSRSWFNLAPLATHGSRRPSGSRCPVLSRTLAICMWLSWLAKPASDWMGRKYGLNIQPFPHFLDSSGRLLASLFA